MIANADSVKLEIYGQLSQLYLEIDPNISRAFARRVIALSTAVNDEEHRYYGNMRLIRGYMNQGIYDSALLYALKIESLASSIGLGKVVELQNEIAEIYKLTSQYEKASRLKFKLLSIADSLGEQKSMATILMDIGELYRDQNETDNAIVYLSKAYDAFEGIGEMRGMLAAKANLALAYSQKDPSQALDIFWEVINEFHSQFSRNDSARALGNLANYLLDLNRMEEAEEYALQAVSLRESLNYPIGLAYSYRELAEIYLRTDRFKKALFLAEKGYPIARKSNDARLLEMFSRQIAEASYELGNYKKAYEFYRDYKLYADSIDQTERVALSKELEVKYETEKKEQQIAFQEEEIARKEAELSQEATLRNALVTGLVMLLVIAGLFYRSERLKTKKNRQIESLLKEIHHRVKNNLQVISSLLNMQSRETKDDEMLSVIREGQSRVKAMSLIHQKLYQNENISAIDFQEYIRDLLDQVASLYQKEGVEIEKEINAAQLKLDIDTAIPLGLILNELISNAFKYAFQGMKKGKLSVVLKRIDVGQLELLVKDNGKGLPSGIDLKKSKSMGLKLVNILTKQLKGNWTYSFDHGTQFIIRFYELKPSA
ncbi:MAG: hypothetical protein Tsb0034_03350 [Ekhidna sp.]